MDYHIVLGIIAVIVGIIANVPYLINTIKGKSKPHFFSWIIWFLIAVIAFTVQLVKGGGAGAWMNGVVSLFLLLIALIGLFKVGVNYVKKIDWICLVLSILGIPIWIITKNPLTAIIIISLVTIISFIPTIRKAYHRPYEETAATYTIAVLQHALSLSALQAFNLTTSLYSIVFIINNFSVALILFLRRRTN